MQVGYSLTLEQNVLLKPKAEKRAPDIERVIGAAYPEAHAVWELRKGGSTRELALVVRTGERQAEEPISLAELDANGEFDKKLHRVNDTLAHNGVWRVAVRELIDHARDWCADLPDATIKDEEVELNEERSGRYKLPALEIRNRSSFMWVKPIAGWVVNPTWVERAPSATTNRAVGRVDLRGPGGPIYLYCLEPEGGWVYQANVLYPESASYLFYQLDKDSFLELARVCLNG